MKRPLGLCCLFALVLATPASAASELGAGALEVQRCIERNLPERSSRQSVEFERQDRAGNLRRIEARIWWKRDAEGHSRLLARVEAPPDERGTACVLASRVVNTAQVLRG